MCLTSQRTADVWKMLNHYHGTYDMFTEKSSKDKLCDKGVKLSIKLINEMNQLGLYWPI